MKALKNKWVLFLIVIIMFVIIDLEIKNVTLSERGIVLGIGIDKESDEYIVTTEILAPSNMGAENYQKNRILALERGNTIREAFEKMDKALGVRVSLKHTLLIVLGDSMLKNGEYGPLIDLFTHNEVSDNTYIVGVDGSAKSLFSANPPLYSTISYKIAETFRSPDVESGTVITNVKDFFKLYLSPSGAMYIPVAEVGHGNISESNGSGEDENTDSISLGKIAVLDRTGLKVILDEVGSAGMSYIYGGVNEANLYVDNGTSDDSFELDILDTLTTRELDVKNNILTINTKMWVKLSKSKNELKAGDNKAFCSDEIELAGEIIAKRIKKAYLTCHEKGVDVLGIASLYYQKMGKEYKNHIGDKYLDNIGIEVKVNIIEK